jgi:hypothetical protein
VTGGGLDVRPNDVYENPVIARSSLSAGFTGRSMVHSICHCNSGTSSVVRVLLHLSCPCPRQRAGRTNAVVDRELDGVSESGWCNRVRGTTTSGCEMHIPV